MNESLVAAAYCDVGREVQRYLRVTRKRHVPLAMLEREVAVAIPAIVRAIQPAVWRAWVREWAYGLAALAGEGLSHGVTEARQQNPGLVEKARRILT